MAHKDVEQVHDQLDHYRTLLPLQVETNRRQEALRLAQLPGIAGRTGEAAEKPGGDARQAGRPDRARRRSAGRITALDLKIGENRNRGERLAEITPPTGFKIAADIDEYYLGACTRGPGGRCDAERPDAIDLQVARVYPQVKGGDLHRRPRF